MKTFNTFIFEASSLCNNTKKDVDCPIHGKSTCPGMKPHKSIEEISKKHDVSLDKLAKQLELGIKVEKEHTKNLEIAKNIALQHLEELPDYYTRLKKAEKSPVKEQYTRIQSSGATYAILLTWKGRYIQSQMFFPQTKRPTKKEITDEIVKIYPGAIVISFAPAMKDPTKPLLFIGKNNESWRYWN